MNFLDDYERDNAMSATPVCFPPDAQDKKSFRLRPAVARMAVVWIYRVDVVSGIFILEHDVDGVWAAR